MELTNVFIYTKSKSFLLPAGFITKITMPLFCKFIQRKLEKIFKPLSELSPPPFNLKLVFKYTKTKKNQPPCKTVTDNVHNKHNASALELHVYRTFLNIVWGIVLLTFTQYLVTIHLHHWGVECYIGVYSFCLQLLIYTSYTSSKVRFHSLRSQDGIFPHDFTISPRKLLA